MDNRLILKMMGELFYVIISLGAVYGIWDLFRKYRKINSTIIKTHITRYELQKLIESRSR